MSSGSFFAPNTCSSMKGGIAMFRKVERYLEETWRNKLIAVVILAIGVFTARISTDATFLIFTLLLGIPLFLSKENVIY